MTSRKLVAVVSGVATVVSLAAGVVAGADQAAPARAQGPGAGQPPEGVRAGDRRDAVEANPANWLMWRRTSTATVSAR